MRKLPLPLVAALFSAVAAQDPGELFRKAPPEVDAALRSRIAAFFQAHVDGKFRQAEAYVAEDTKDFFYAANKPKYFSFEIKQIEYSENFAKAKATVIVEQTIMVPGFAGKPLKIPVPSYWKIENNDWYWYVDQEAARHTPFGVRPKDADKSAGAGGGTLPAQIPQGPEAIRALWSKVKVDRSEVQLAPGGFAEVKLHNGIPGPITVGLDGAAPPGLTVKLPASVKPGESAILSIAAGPDLPAKPGTAYTIALRIQPTNQPIPIRVTTAAKR